MGEHHSGWQKTLHEKTGQDVYFWNFLILMIFTVVEVGVVEGDGVIGSGFESVGQATFSVDVDIRNSVVNGEDTASTNDGVLLASEETSGFTSTHTGHDEGHQSNEGIEEGKTVFTHQLARIPQTKTENSSQNFEVTYGIVIIDKLNFFNQFT